MDRLAALEAFVRVAETGSFSEAARWLQVAPSVVSRRIVELERDFAATLFRRTTRSVSLTTAGESLLVRASEALAALEEARAELGQAAVAPRGRLRVSAPTSFGALVLAPAICDFREQHPGVEVELILLDRPVHPATDGFDLVVDDTGRPPEAAVARPLQPIARIAVAAPGYLRRHGAPRTPRDLSRHHCIHYSELESGGSWRFVSRRGVSVRVRVPAVITTNNGGVMRDAALAGQGVAILPRFLAEEALSSADLLPVLEKWTVPDVPLAVVHARSPYMPLRVRLVRDFLLERFTAAARPA